MLKEKSTLKTIVTWLVLEIMCMRVVYGKVLRTVSANLHNCYGSCQMRHVNSDFIHKAFCCFSLLLCTHRHTCNNMKI